MKLLLKKSKFQSVSDITCCGLPGIWSKTCTSAKCSAECDNLSWVSWRGWFCLEETLWFSPLTCVSVFRRCLSRLWQIWRPWNSALSKSWSCGPGSAVAPGKRHPDWTNWHLSFRHVCSSLNPLLYLHFSETSLPCYNYSQMTETLMKVQSINQINVFHSQKKTKKDF